MTCARRLVAATLMCLLAVVPVALEHCRAACAGGTTQATEPSAQAYPCHNVASDDADAVVVPMPRTCGHGDEARASELLGLAGSKTRAHLTATPAIAPAVWGSPVPPGRAAAPPGTDRLPTFVAAPRDLPLRL